MIGLFVFVLLFVLLRRFILRALLAIAAVVVLASKFRIFVYVGFVVYCALAIYASVRRQQARARAAAERATQITVCDGQSIEQAFRAGHDKLLIGGKEHVRIVRVDGNVVTIARETRM